MTNVIFSATILGQPIVKKNNQKVTFRNGKPHKYNTAAYTKWLKSANRQLNYFKLPTHPITGPVIFMCNFFMQTKGIVDLSALYEGVQDLFVKRGIIEDDNSRIIVGHDGSRVYYDKDNPRIEISIITTQNPGVGYIDNTPHIVHTTPLPRTDSVF